MLRRILGGHSCGSVLFCFRGGGRVDDMKKPAVWRVVRLMQELFFSRKER